MRHQYGLGQGPRVYCKACGLPMLGVGEQDPRRWNHNNFFAKTYCVLRMEHAAQDFKAQLDEKNRRLIETNKFLFDANAQCEKLAAALEWYQLNYFPDEGETSVNVKFREALAEYQKFKEIK